MEKNLNSGSSRVLVGALADNLAGLPAAKETNLSDFSLFLSVMKNKDAHTSVLSIIMGEPKLQLEKIHVEEVILNHDGRRGIRLDAWAKEAGDKGRHFGTEMQNDTTTDHIPKRARFYQGLMDSPMLKSGRATKYRSLPPTVVSFITPNDIFGRDLARYTFTEQCEELPGLHLEDGTTKIFLNMASKNGDPALVSLLQYMKHTTLENPDVETIDDRIRKLDEVVNEVRESEEWENVRMSILSIGIEQGKREGLAQGLERGRRDALRQQVLKKLTKGKTAVQIADEIEEEVSVVEELITELQGERES